MECMPNYSGQRLRSLDLVRGLALFGILLANMRGYAAPEAVYHHPERFWPDPTSQFVQFLVDVFVTNKFLTLFGLLFGIGVAIQSDRALANQQRVAGILLRRMAMLAALGLAHGLLLWWGDILLLYALAGTLLILFRNLEPERILFWAILLYAFPLLFITGMAAVGAGSPAPESSPNWQWVVEAYRGEAFWSLVPIRAREWLDFYGNSPVVFPRVLGLFLLGTYLWRCGMVKELDGQPERLAKVARKWLAAGLGLNLLVATLRWYGHVDADRPTGGAIILWAADSVGVPLLAGSYASGFIWLSRHSSLHRLWSWIAQTGRMSLTVYLTQSVVGATLFCGWGLGLYGRMTLPRLLILGLVIYAVQVAACNLWLRWFCYGPLEWIWRVFTYQRFVPIRRPL